MDASIAKPDDFESGDGITTMPQDTSSKRLGSAPLTQVEYDTQDCQDDTATWF